MHIILYYTSKSSSLWKPPPWKRIWHEPSGFKSASSWAFGQLVALHQKIPSCSSLFVAAETVAADFPSPPHSFQPWVWFLFPFTVGMAVSRWDLGIFWNYGSSPDYKGHFQCGKWWKMDTLKGGLHSTVPHWDLCPPQASPSSLQNFPNLDLATLTPNALLETGEERPGSPNWE